MSLTDESEKKTKEECSEQEHSFSKSDSTAGYDWLDRDYIQKSIREGLKDQDIIITDFEIKPATVKGENYASVVFKCKATDDSGKEHLTIIKCLPTNSMRQKFCNIGHIFRKEIEMYTVIFPYFEGMLREKGLKIFWPKYYYSTIDGLSDTVVLKDASPLGYTMRERRKGLSLGHLEIVLAALARFHACSVLMKIRDPEAFDRKVADRFPEKLFSSDNEEMKNWAQNCVVSVSDVIRNWGDEKYLKIADKIMEWKDSFYDDVADSLTPKDGALLTHGDFWINNMLFKYNTYEEAKNGLHTPIDMLMLDFQIARYCSPAADLTYFMITSIDTETKRRHWSNLLEHAYLDNFWKDIECMGHKNDIRNGLYSLEWLKAEMMSYRKFALFTAATILRVVVANTEDAPDLDDLKEEDMKSHRDPFENLNKDKTFQERYRGVVDDLAETGFFE